MTVRSTTRPRLPGRGRWRHGRLLVLLALVLAAAYIFVRGDGGLKRLYERWGTLRDAEVRAVRLEAETDSLRQILWLLENDLDYVEKVAREEYGMSRPSERVYRLPLSSERSGGD